MTAITAVCVFLALVRWAAPLAFLLGCVGTTAGIIVFLGRFDEFPVVRSATVAVITATILSALLGGLSASLGAWLAPPAESETLWLSNDWRTRFLAAAIGGHAGFFISIWTAMVAGVIVAIIKATNGRRHEHLH